MMRQAVHRDPVWRDQSNFIITAEVDPGDTDVATEQLWARKVDDRHYRLCCIPFFVYDLALDDVVEAGPSGDWNYLFRRVVRPSGRYVFRIWFGDSPSSREQVARDLAGLGALTEWSSRHLLAVDPRDRDHAERVSAYLQSEEDLGHLVYETGRTH